MRRTPLTRKTPMPSSGALKRSPIKRKSRPRHTAAEDRHLAAVAALGCLVCGAHAEVHHVRSGCGVGQRASHFKVLPLCPGHHREGGFGVAFHAGPREWQRRYGTEDDLLARVADLLAVR